MALFCQYETLHYNAKKFVKLKLKGRVKNENLELEGD